MDRLTSNGPRLALAITDPGLEGPLVVALQQAGATVDRYLAGDTLLAALRSQPVDAVLLDTNLNRVTPAVASQVISSGAPLLIFAQDSQHETWAGKATIVFDHHADASTLAGALLNAANQRRSRGYVAASTPWSTKETAFVPEPPNGPEALLANPSASTRQPSLANERRGQRAPVIALAAATSGVGCTTVAINLALALGAVRPSTLIDLDLVHPCVAAYVAADILRNLAMLAQDVPTSPEGWQRAVTGELQALDGRCREAQLLLGVPDSSRAPAVSVALFQGTLNALKEGSDDGFIFVDLGGDLLRPNTAVQRTALLAADQVLLVARADSVSLWQAHEAAEAWQGQVGVSKERMALVVTRYDRRFHQSPVQIGWNVGVPIAALVPDDRRHAERAVSAQQALLFERRSRAGRALLELADRLYGGDIILPRTDMAPTRRRRMLWRGETRRHVREEGVAGEPGVAVC